MHTFGLPVDMVAIQDVCEKYGLKIVEDSAESLGSYINNTHTGTFGLCGTLSFNGNKTITTGGGGMIITDDEELAKKAKHITTTAKIPHRWDYEHDMVGFNYRMPNINAALGCAQLEKLPIFLQRKETLAQMYREFFQGMEIDFIEPREGTTPNYWLNAVRLQNRAQRDLFLDETNNAGVMTRPIWKLMNKLDMFNSAQCGNLDNSLWLEERVVNIPSSVTV
jgi:dTDP-4-amino-4,6-dideoxygalactose transaminase